MATQQTGAVRAGKMGRGLRAAGLCALLAVAAHPSFAAGGGRGAPAGRTGAMRGGWVGAGRPLRPPLLLADGVTDIIADAPAQRVLVMTSSRVYTLDEATGRPLGFVPLTERRHTFSGPHVPLSGPGVVSGWQRQRQRRQARNSAAGGGGMDVGAHIGRQRWGEGQVGR